MSDSFQLIIQHTPKTPLTFIISKPDVATQDGNTAFEILIYNHVPIFFFSSYKPSVLLKLM